MITTRMYVDYSQGTFEKVFKLPFLLVAGMGFVDNEPSSWSHVVVDTVTWFDAKDELVCFCKFPETHVENMEPAKLRQLMEAIGWTDNPD